MLCMLCRVELFGHETPPYCNDCTPRAQAIRADERAKVEREVVAYLYEQAPHWRDEDGESALMHAREVIAAGEHRPKPGQPKEGGQ